MDIEIFYKKQTNKQTTTTKKEKHKTKKLVQR